MALLPSQIIWFEGWVLNTIVAVVVTVKSLALVAVLPLTVTVIFPVVAPDGTVVVMLVVELAVALVKTP